MTISSAFLPAYSSFATELRKGGVAEGVDTNTLDPCDDRGLGPSVFNKFNLDVGRPIGVGQVSFMYALCRCAIQTANRKKPSW